MGNKRLVDILAEARDLVRRGVHFYKRDFAEEWAPELSAEEQYRMAVDGLAEAVGDLLRKRGGGGGGRSPGQPGLFDHLPEAVPIDTEGNRMIATELLTQMQVERVLRVREAGMEADRLSYEDWKQYYDIARPYWAVHPDWTFGRCIEAAARDGRMIA